MIAEYRLILKRDEKSILEDTIVLDGFSTDLASFEKRIRDYIRGLNK